MLQLIDHQCPQCGAPATLEETDRLFTCDYCRVKSFLLSRVYRYVLPHRAAPGRDLFYIPYWRFKGMLFSCLGDGIRHRIVDVSYQGLRSSRFPVSLGLRSQALRLRFLTPATRGRFLHPDVSFNEMMGKVGERYRKALPPPVFLQQFIGESLALLYSPFYLDGKLFDAVLDRPVTGSPPGDFDPAALPGGPPRWRLEFVPAQCPDCGWDLEGERDSLALDCRNCHSLWHAGKERFLRLKFAYVPASPDAGLVYLPFWRIRAAVSGMDLDSEADLVRVANLPRVVKPGMEERRFHFWSPAFKVRPKDFLRFSLRMTLAQPGGDWERSLPGGELYPVTLSLTEAAESLKTCLASFAKPPGKIHPLMEERHIQPEGFLLVYFPFVLRGNELTYPSLRLRINRNLLRYAKTL